MQCRVGLHHELSWVSQVGGGGLRAWELCCNVQVWGGGCKQSWPGVLQELCWVSAVRACTVVQGCVVSRVVVNRAEQKLC
jgi:hypothetical protein